MSIDPKRIKKILVVRNDRFGEFLLNIPAIRALRDTFAQAEIICVVDTKVKELAIGVPYIDEILTFGHAGQSLEDKLRFAVLLKKKKIDMAVILNPSKDFHLFSYLAGIPVRVGYDRKWGFLLTHKIKDHKYLGTRHEVEYNLELVGLVGAKTQDSGLALVLDNAVIDNHPEFIVLHPWTSDPVKEWPPDNFRDLAKKIIQQLKKKVIIAGGSENARKSKELFCGFGDDLIDMTGETTLRKLAGLLKQCRLLVSADSGPVHLACCVDAPVIALFRIDMPGKNSKRWGPWGKKGMVIEKKTLAEISVEEVFERIQEVLRRDE